MEELSIVPADPRASYISHRAEIDAAVGECLSSGRYILGEQVHQFEEEFARYVGVQHACGVANGTDALTIALRACSVGAGDEVITVAHTAVATVAAIELCGATPVLVDIDPLTYTMNPASFEAAISSRTKAVVPVNLYGQAADLPEIMKIARAHGLKVIEDCAQSHGATLQSRMTGSWGHIAAFSFYPTKNLGALGDGGMIVTNDNDLARRVRLLREYGWAQRYVSEIAGCNSRLDELQAAVLRVKLRHLDEDTRRRQALAKIYTSRLSVAGVNCPTVRRDAVHVYHLYVIRHSRRDELRGHLGDGRIGTAIHYPTPVHLQPAYLGRLRISGDLRETERAAQEILSLPLYPELAPVAVNHVCDRICSWAA
jgi:dTDP-4-amino-4,6-dideoxygalactose transaminase